MDVSSSKQQNETSTSRGRGRPRSEVSRQRILDAALETLQVAGFAASTTDSIAERAGASKATIYRWWPTKASLLAEALREAVAEEVPFPETGDLATDIDLQLQNFIGLLGGRLGRAFKAFVGAAQSDPEVAAAFLEEWVKPRRKEAKTVLARYQTEGQIAPDVDLDLVLDILYGPVYFRLLSGFGDLTPDYARQITSFALNGLASQREYSVR
ncbi:MAG: TetR/AcrR family transcriptional regulator [Bryobacteraceae bacterium]